jgi:hypothetical protein
VQTTTQADRLEREAEDAARSAERKAKDAKAKAHSKASKASKRIRDNSDNPVVLGNAVLSLALFGTLGYGAYVKYRAGEFTWKLVGIGAAVLGAFGVADYYATKYDYRSSLVQCLQLLTFCRFLFQKYPPKK